MLQTNPQQQEVSNMAGLEAHIVKMRLVHGGKCQQDLAEIKTFGDTQGRLAALANLKSAIEEFKQVAPLCDVIINMQLALGELIDEQIVERAGK